MLFIENKTKYNFKYKQLFKKIVKLIIKEESLIVKTEVNLIIVSNKKIKELSNQYRSQDKETDVLSFPTDYKTLFKKINYYMLGDIYISYQRILEQAQTYNHSLKREWSYLFTHGIYHLLGFDHANDQTKEKIMNSKVNNIMKLIKVGRND